MAKCYYGGARPRVNPTPNRGTGTVHLSDRLRIERYGDRNWAIYLDGGLLAVTAYRKGALAVGNVLMSKDPSLRTPTAE